MPITCGDIRTISDYTQHYYKRGFVGLESDRIGFGDALNTTYGNAFEVKILSPFFKKLLTKCSVSTWVEIENEYYSLLKRHLDPNTKENLIETLDVLNTRFSYLAEQLEKYLQSLPIPQPLPDYREIFQSNIQEKDIVGDVKITGSCVPEKTMILNFNYTSSIDLYYNPSAKFESPTHRKFVNHIHGELQNKDNPVIFGFGDELDSAYLKMELETARGFFSFIKSFWYFKTSNYHNLIRFIDSTKFQVVILGHSCGLSDRTMLNMIFEHNNCVSIKIYYHGNLDTNNYTEITQDISRHFTNKQQMRRKIVPFDKCKSMPQHDSQRQNVDQEEKI